MAQRATLEVKGYRELVRAFKTAEKEERLGMRHALRDVGMIVQRDAVRWLSPISPRSAAGYKVSVTQRNVAVYQSLRKTTGKRPMWGYFQMRFNLIRALFEKRRETEQAFERFLDRMADHFNRGGAL